MPTPLEEAALALKAWAAAKGILTYEPPEDLAEHEPENLSDATDAADPAAAEQVLRNRRINFVGVDDTNNKIVICTHKKISAKEFDILPQETGEFEIKYIKSHLPAVNSPRPGPTFHGPFHVHRDRYACGSSVFPGNKIGAGTMGALLRDGNGELYGLSNNHVTGGCNYSEPSLPIIAPGPLDVAAGSHDPFTIGHHHRLLGLRGGNPDNVDITGNLDAATFKIADPNRVSSMQRGFYDTPATAAQIATGMLVEKVGRTTGHTQGVVVARSVGFERVEYNVPEYAFRSVIYYTRLFAVQGLGQAFADRGDSGALVVSTDTGTGRRAVGLLFGVSPDLSLTLVAPLDTILTEFGMSLVSNHHI